MTLLERVHFWMALGRDGDTAMGVVRGDPLKTLEQVRESLGRRAEANPDYVVTVRNARLELVGRWLVKPGSPSRQPAAARGASGSPPPLPRMRPQPA